MFQETDGEKVNVTSSSDSQDIEKNLKRDDDVRSPNSRLSSASKKKADTHVHHPFDHDQSPNVTRIKSSNSSHQDTSEIPIDALHHHQPQMDELNLINDSIDDKTNDDDDEQKESFRDPVISSTHFQNDAKPSTTQSNKQPVNNSVPDHPSCQFRTEIQWVDLQFHPDESNEKVEELDTKKVKKPKELENEMEDPPGTIDKEILNRIQGSIVGLALGDALGAHVEFRPREYMKEHLVKDLEGGGTWGLDKGQFTDDASMALCLANSLLARHDFVPYDQLVRYKWWNKYGYMSSTGQCFDIGAATSQSIHMFQQRQKTFAKEKNLPLQRLDYLSDNNLLAQFDVYCSDDDAAGNGALMRLAPVPLFFFRNKYAAVEYSGRSGKITHGDIKAFDACRFYGALIVAALRGYTKVQILAPNFYSKHKHWFGEEPLHDEIIKIARGSYKKTYGYDGGIRGKGYIVSALEAALWAFWSDGDSFETGVLAAVNLGDDTDTTAAIYGQLAGAYYGYDKLPQRWVEQIYALNFLKTLSKWIVYEGEQWTQKTEKSFTKE